MSQSEVDELRVFYCENLVNSLARSGWESEASIVKKDTPESEIIDNVVDVFDNIYAEGNGYLRRTAFNPEPIPYDGALFGYVDFLAPLVKRLVSLSFMPNGPLYLLIDDADNLSESQTLILNSWVASRTTGYLCLKISTQTLEYKIYKTPNGKRIDSPHDFSEVHICDIYTTKKDTYKDRVQKIVEKHLSAWGITSDPYEIFPEDVKQEKEIKVIAKQLKDDFQNSGRGAKPSDDALRYSRPNFIKDLAGIRKAGSTYSYADFDQLVHISSGVIRHFLDAASLMYGEVQSRQGSDEIGQIPPGIQNEVVRDLANKLIFNDFSDFERDESNTEQGRDNVKKLRNLIQALGGMFYEILISDAADRRVFSVAFTDGPSDEVQEVLNLGVKYGYFHQSSIGNKEGTGRVPLYILSRRLAPAFKLDPTSFAEYKFVQNIAIEEAMHRPKKLLSQVKIKGFDAVMELDVQGEFFHDS